MKKIFLWFLLLQKRQLKHIAMTALLLLIPLSTFIIRQIPSMQEQTIPRIGLVLTDSDTLSVKTVDALCNNQQALDFYVCDSIETLQKDILNNNASCGYVFSESLTDKLDKNSYKGCIAVLNSSTGIISALSSEVVFSEMFRFYGKNIVANFVTKDSIFSEIRANALSKAEEQYDYYINGAATFHINFKTLDERIPNDASFTTPDSQGIASSNTSMSAAFPVRGVLAVILFTVGILGCIQWIRDNENGVFAPMSYSFIHVSRFLYILAPVMLFSISCLLTIFLAGVSTSIQKELIGMAVYIVFIVLFSTLLTFIIRKSIILISMLPILILGSLILCPVFINITQFVPVAGILNKFFLPYYYLHLF